MPVLRLMLAPEVRATLTAWLKVYGDANGLPGLATGPIEARFNRLREHAQAEEMVIWTTPERRAAGDGPRIRIPALQVDLECRFKDGHIVAEKMAQVPGDAREPQRERGSVGVEMMVERIELPPEAERPDPLAQEIEGIFDRLTGNRWRGFVAPLREALEAEARDDAKRAEQVSTPYVRAEPRAGGRGQENPFRLFGLTASAAAAFEEGEWLDLLNERGASVATARLVNVDVGSGVMDVDARGGDPPMPGIVRPRPRTKILAQKRAILTELESPSGNLPLLARLMASPAAMPIPRPLFPSKWLNPAVGRSRAQSRAVALALGLAEGEALLIEGPPGTGKSTTTAEMVAQILSRDPLVRILVCSHSNHGTDNMLMKVMPYVPGTAGDHGKVTHLEPARVGMFDRVSPELRRFFVGPDDNLSDRNVVFTTIDALALNDAAGGSVYDYVILDEANRATVLDSLVALARGKRFILVGDRLQLQPVLSEAEEQLRLEPAMARTGVIGKSLFVWVTERHFPDRSVVFLDEQNRMHPMIGGLIARAFYDDRLRNGPAAPRRDTAVPHFAQPACWVDTRGLRGLRESRGRGPSLFNLPEARLVTTIARHLLKDAPADMDVGVIAAYAEQVALLRRLLRNDVRGSGAGANGGRRLEIDTVDAFEGREKDVVVVSLVRSNRRREIGFLQLMQRINVALSRARRLLIIVGDTATLRGSYFDKVLRYLRERNAVTPGPRVIAQLRGLPVHGRDGQTRDGQGRRDRFKDRRRGEQRERAAEATAPAEAAPVLDGLPPPIPIDADPELAAALAEVQDDRHEHRRPNRQRRSPEEILARLNQTIQPGAEAAPAGDDATSEVDATGPRPSRRSRGRRRGGRSEDAGSVEQQLTLAEPASDAAQSVSTEVARPESAPASEADSPAPSRSRRRPRAEANGALPTTEPLPLAEAAPRSPADPAPIVGSDPRPDGTASKARPARKPRSASVAENPVAAPTPAPAPSTPEPASAESATPRRGRARVGSAAASRLAETASSFGAAPSANGASAQPEVAAVEPAAAAPKRPSRRRPAAEGASDSA